MNRYQSWTQRPKMLTDILWPLRYAAKKNDIEERDQLLSKLLQVFDQLSGPEENREHVDAIKQKIVTDVQNNTTNDIELAQLMRSILVYGYS
jgi:hypothetical protein